MGADIHGPYIEQRDPDTRYDDEEPHWSHIATVKIHRNYQLFALMAEVRRYDYFPLDERMFEVLTERGIISSSKDEFEKLSESEQKEFAKKFEDYVATLNDKEKEQIGKELRDSGITMGQESFEPRGVPKDADYFKAISDYTMWVREEESANAEEHECSRKKADEWIKNGSSKVWDTDEDGKVSRITHPDWHSASWLSTDEIEELIKRYESALKALIPTARKEMERAAKFYEKAPEKIRDKFCSWEYCNPMNNHDLKLLRGMLSMMRAIETPERPCRIIFWFDN